MNAPDFFRLAQQTQEAYCVQHGIPVKRKFSDVELASAHAGIVSAERELYGDMSEDERLGRLAPEERALLDELDDAAPLISFRVTAWAGGQMEQIGILARTSCDAAVQAINLLFSDSDDCIAATGFKVKVEPIHRQREGRQWAA